MQSHSCKAYGKLNLTLDITGLRPDGYHELVTLMHSISIYDTVTIKPSRREGIWLRCNLAYVPCDERNIAHQAAVLFLDAAGRRANILIDLRKRIPVGAGMAGGSANAAAVLQLLNKIYGNPLPKPQLAQLALRLGADVPFCLETGCCMATGIGEVLTPAPSLPPCSIAVVKPRFSISSKKLYEKIDSVPIAKHPDTVAMLNALKRKDLPAIAAGLENVMEPAAILERPQIGEIRQGLLAAGALGARMTGSGSAVYGIFDEEEKARAALVPFQQQGMQTFVAHPIT